MKSASKAISVFHSLSPPKSLSSAFKLELPVEVRATTLVVAKNNSLQRADSPMEIWSRLY